MVKYLLKYVAFLYNKVFVLVVVKLKKKNPRYRAKDTVGLSEMYICS